MKKTILILSLFLTTSVYSNAFDDFMSNDVTKKSLSNLKEYASENDYKKVLKEVEKVRITYDKNVEYIENYHSSVERIQSNDNSIPKVLHFIWLGNKPYPTSSKTNLDRWIKLHPKFKIILWTDQNSVFEDKYQGLIEERDVEEFINLYKDDYPKLITLLKQSMNPGEKSDLIRYMILDKLGGVYIDHDIYPHKEISYLISEFSFICCCEPITPTVNKQYFRTSNAFIASKINHKIIKNTIEIICNNWDHSTETMHSVNIYAYKDHSPVNNNILVLLRTYIPFTYAVLNTEIGDDDLILPPQYFTPDVYNDVHNFKTDFIAHESKGAWACRDLDSTNYSKITSSQLSKKINKISKKLTRSFNLILTLVFLFFILLSWLLIKRIIRK